MPRWRARPPTPTRGPAWAPRRCGTCFWRRGRGRSTRRGWRRWGQRGGGEGVGGRWEKGSGEEGSGERGGDELGAGSKGQWGATGELEGVLMIAARPPAMLLTTSCPSPLTPHPSPRNPATTHPATRHPLPHAPTLTPSAQVNAAEADYWRRATGTRVGWSDQILGFDCGGQQWVLEVAFQVGGRVCAWACVRVHARVRVRVHVCLDSIRAGTVYRSYVLMWEYLLQMKHGMLARAPPKTAWVPWGVHGTACTRRAWRGLQDGSRTGPALHGRGTIGSGASHLCPRRPCQSTTRMPNTPSDRPSFYGPHHYSLPTLLAPDPARHNTPHPAPHARTQVAPSLDALKPGAQTRDLQFMDDLLAEIKK